MKRALSLTLVFISTIIFAQEDTLGLQSIISDKWYDKVKIGGYLQVRYNDLYKSNPDMESPQGDRTYGGHKGFSLRRMRMKISGQVHPRLYFYFQADFASDGKNLGQLRDAYFDYFVDKEGRVRIRGGQSKIPFGFENLQSSQNRLGHDRNEPLNSAVKDERDMGIGIHYAPIKIRERFRKINKMKLRGSGDYGMVYLMFYNGQKGNALVPDVLKVPHVALRFSYPFESSSGQFYEASIQGFTGFTVTELVTPGVLLRDDSGNILNESAENGEFLDRRVGVSFVYYPQPFGFQFEYNLGVGPRFAYDATSGIGSIGREQLHGGYGQIMYDIRYGKHKIMPFSRFMYYFGGKKFELDARRYDMKELEIGVEWEPIPAFELNVTYTIADRRYEDMLMPDNRQTGSLIRVQMQVNY